MTDKYEELKNNAEEAKEQEEKKQDNNSVGQEQTKEDVQKTFE